MYVTLDRLEDKGLLCARDSPTRTTIAADVRDATSRVTALGVRELRASRTALLKLWRGLEGVLENS